jgi:hypothetical protein
VPGRLTGSYLPLLATGVLQLSTLSQIGQMVLERSSASQSLIGWMLSNLGLTLWLVFFTRYTPNERFAVWSGRIGLAVNIVGTMAVLLYR